MWQGDISGMTDSGHVADTHYLSSSSKKLDYSPSLTIEFLLVLNKKMFKQILLTSTTGYLYYRRYEKVGGCGGGNKEREGGFSVRFPQCIHLKKMFISIKKKCIKKK